MTTPPKGTPPEEGNWRGGELVVANPLKKHFYTAFTSFYIRDDGGPKRAQ